jgi:hypothetical protein
LDSGVYTGFSRWKVALVRRASSLLEAGKSFRVLAANHASAKWNFRNFLQTFLQYSF